jgi:hypothetical protein
MPHWHVRFRQRRKYDAAGRQPLIKIVAESLTGNLRQRSRPVVKLADLERSARREVEDFDLFS